MSYSLLYRVTPGVEAVSVKELRNGHGLAPAVWGSLAEKVIGIGRYRWGQENFKEVCDVWNDASQFMWLRAVLGMTFDYVYIERQHFQQAALDIEAFLSWAEVPVGHVNHWPQVVDLLRRHRDDESFPALGFMHTSVGENLWTSHIEETDDGEAIEHPIEWDKTWSLYAELAGAVRPEGTKG